MWVCGNNVQPPNLSAALLFSVEQGLSFPSSTSFSKLSKLLVPLNDIIFAGRTFRLNAPITLSLFVEDGGWVSEFAPFSSLSFGSTPEEAVRAFCEDFSVIWDEIAASPDETLASDARKVKLAILSAVKTVEPEPLKCR